MRRFFKWLAIAVASLLGLIVVAVAGLLIAMHTDWGREQIRKQAQARVGELFTGTMELGPIRGSVLSSFSIDGLLLRDSEGKEMLRAKRVIIDYKLLALIDRSFKAHSIEIVEPVVWGRLDENGELNLKHLLKPQPKTESAPWLLDITDVRITNGLVVFPTASQTFSFANINLDAKLKVATTNKQFELVRAQAIWLQRGVPITAHGNIVQSDPLVAIAGLEVLAGKSRVSIPLGMVRPSAQAVIAAFDADLREADLFLFWPHAFAMGNTSLGGAVMRGGGEQPIEVRLLAKTLGGEVWAAVALNPALPALTGELRARGVSSPLPTLIAKLDADLSFDVAGQTLETLKGTADFGAKGVVAGRKIDSLRIAAVAGGGVARVDLTAEVPSAQATAHADLRLASPMVLDSARVKAQIMDLGAAAGIPNLDGQMDIEVTAKGSFDALAVDGKADLRRLRSGTSRVASAQATFAMTGLPKDPRGSVRVDARDVTSGKNAFGNVAVTATAPGGRVFDVRVAQGGPALPYAVRAGARIGLEEQATRVTLRDLQATARGLTFTGKGGEVLLRKNGSVAARGVALRSPAGNLILEGDLAPARRQTGRTMSLPTGKLHVHLQNLDLARLRTAFAPEARAIAGKLSADLHVVRDGKTLGLEGEIAAGRLDVGGQVPIIDATLRLNIFKGKLVTAGHVRTEHAGGKDKGKSVGVADFAIESKVPVDVTDTGAWKRIDIDEALAGARVTVRDLDLGAVAELTGRRGIAGRLDATLEGRPATRAVAFDFKVSGLAMENRVKGVGIKVDGVWDHDALDVNAHGALGEGEIISAKARLAIGLHAVINGADVDNLPIDAKLTMDKVDLARLADVLPMQKDTEGQLSVDATVKGTVSKPSGKANVVLANAKLGGVPFNEVTAKADLDAAHLEGVVVASQTSGGRLEASGRVERTRDDNTVTARITAKTFDLAFLSAMAKTRSDSLYGAGGILDADLRVTAARGSRSANGKVQLSRGQFYLPTSGLIKDIELVASIDKGRVVIEKLSGRAANGTVKAEGEAILAGLTPERFRVDIATEKFPVDAGSMVVAVDTKGKITGTRTDEEWALDATFSGTRVHMPKQRRTGEPLQRTGDLQDVVFVDVPDFQRRTALIALTGSPDVQEGGKREISLVVHTPGGVRISGQELDMTANTGLAIHVRGAQTYVGGGVEVSSGFIELFGRRYDVVRAKASFDDNEVPNPRLDIRLSHDFTSTTLYIDVTGTVRRPILKLSAEPGSYDQATLIGWVLGGSPDDPDHGKTSVNDQAIGLASNMVLGQVQNIVKTVLPVDVLAVQQGEDGDTQTTRFEVGKWVMEDLFVGYVYRMNAPEEKNLNEAEIEYRLSRRWLLEAFFGDRGVAGADVIWSKKY